MEIVSYEIKDSAVVASFFREIFKEMGWVERGSDHMDEPHLLFHLPDKGLLLLVKKNNKVVGTAGVIELSKTEGLIKRFYISQSLRGSGIAGKLLGELINKSLLMGLKKLILDVRKTNGRAIRFYEKNGFKQTSVTPVDDWPESFSPGAFNYYLKIIKEDNNLIKEIQIKLFNKKYSVGLSKMIYQVIKQLEKENPELNYGLVRAEDTPEELVKASKEGKMWIALFNDEIVGTLSLQGNRLRRFFIHPKFQGRRIGRELVVVVKHYARHNNLKEIWVGSLLRAVPIYKKLGFSEGKVFFNSEINQEEMELKMIVE